MRVHPRQGERRRETARSRLRATVWIRTQGVVDPGPREHDGRSGFAEDSSPMPRRKPRPLPTGDSTTCPRRPARPADRRRGLFLALWTAIGLLVSAGCAAGSAGGGAAGNGGSHQTGGARGGTGGGEAGSGGAGGDGGAAGEADAGGDHPEGDTKGAIAPDGGDQSSADSAITGGDDAATAVDAATTADAAQACGLSGQICCAGNGCAAGAHPSAAPGGGSVAVELVASGGDPYALFQAKNLWPIDGPAAGYITDTGTSFKFVLHQTGAEETVSSGANRQRNELTVNPSNPALYKGMNGDTMSYTWRFHLDAINAHPAWCDIFQIKQHGPLGVAPLLQFRTNGDNLEIALRLTTAKTLPLSAILGQWINASLTVKYGHAGTVALELQKDDGSVLVDYENDNADMWDTNVDFVRPKWGLYRNEKPGTGEASIQYNHMRIIRGTIPRDCTCR